MRVNWRIRWPSHSLSSCWDRTLTLVCLNTILPSLLPLFLPTSVPSFEFTPRYLLYPAPRPVAHEDEDYTSQLLPLVSFSFAPWAWPAEFRFGVLVSRVVQAWAIWKICNALSESQAADAAPSNTTSPTLSFSQSATSSTSSLTISPSSSSPLSPSHKSSPIASIFRSLYTIWLYIAVARTILGYVFSRGVGWAYPSLFSHWALYEKSSGFGPSIIALLFSSTGAILRGTGRHYDAPYHRGGWLGWITPLWGMCVMFVWLEDQAVWTYSASVVVGSLVNIGRVLFGSGLMLLPALPSLPINLFTASQYHPVLPTSSSRTAGDDAARTNRGGDVDLGINTGSGKMPADFTFRQAVHGVWRAFVKALSALFIIATFHLLANRLWLGVTGSAPVQVELSDGYYAANDRPLLEILILTYPRPKSPFSPSVLKTTIESYLPYLRHRSFSHGSDHDRVGPSIVLSVFTHAANHSEFEDAKRLFEGYNPLDDSTQAHTRARVRGGDGDEERPLIRFFADTDDHPDDKPGQYLHLAEAFRWVGGVGVDDREHVRVGDINGKRRREVSSGHAPRPGTRISTGAARARTRTREDGSPIPMPTPTGAEWVMLVEDDFPLCGGAKGWEAIVRVLNLLEGSRVSGSDTDSAIPAQRGGFVGTGGSGLIIHRTLLPILQSVLRLHSANQSALPPTPLAGNGSSNSNSAGSGGGRPADLIVQDCLLGVDPLCSSNSYLRSKSRLTSYYSSLPSSRSRSRQGGDVSSLVITSRLVMDHIGGMVSTTKGKTGNRDRWRCGWRHPFHGRADVEVVVVD